MEDGFVKGDNTNLPRINSLMVGKYFAANPDFCSAELRNVKTSMSGRESYGDDAIDYVHLKREQNACIVKCTVCPEHKVRSKPYAATLVVNEKEEAVTSVKCHDCPASKGGCKHGVAFLMWLHRRCEEPSCTSVACYWKKSNLAKVGTSINILSAKEMAKRKPKEFIPESGLMTNYKYLGLTIDKNFNWAMHISNVCNRLRSILGKFYQLSKVLNTATMRIVYFALADALINYGLIVYGRTFSTYLKDIENLQIRLLKYLISKKEKYECNKEYDKLFPMCKILPVKKKNVYLIGLQYYYEDDYKYAIDNIYNTRRVREQKLIKPKVKNYYGHRTNRYLVPKIFNDIDELRKTPKISINILKKRLMAVLLDGVCVV